MPPSHVMAQQRRRRGVLQIFDEYIEVGRTRRDLQDVFRGSTGGEGVRKGDRACERGREGGGSGGVMIEGPRDEKRPTGCV